MDGESYKAVSFYSSNRNEANKARSLLWGFALIGLVIAVLRAPHSTAWMVFLGLTFILAIGLVDRYMLRQFRPGQLVVTLSELGIESPMLSGAIKKLEWKSLLSVSIQAIHDQPYLRLNVSPEMGLRNRRNFITGINPAMPTIPISGLDAASQDRVAESISEFARSYSHLSNVDITNPAREVRDFMEKVKAFAPTPWVTYFLFVTNIIVWMAMLASGAQILGTPLPMLLEWGGNATSSVQEGEWWRLLTSVFIHGNFFHLFLNMVALLSAGLIVERIYGQRLFSLIYFGSGIIGSSLSLYFASQSTISVGSSGAIFGITGALFVAIFQHRDSMPKTFSKQVITTLSFFITYSLVQGITKTGIDNAAHVGGLMAGAMLAFILPGRLDKDSLLRVRGQRTALALVITAIACIGLAQFAPPAKIDVAKNIQGVTASSLGMKQFAEVMAALEKEEKDVAAGRISVLDSDARSRTVFAPMMSAVLVNLHHGALLPEDPRLHLFQATTRMAELLHESLAMESVITPGSDIPLPANPARAAEIKREMLDLMSHLTPPPA